MIVNEMRGIVNKRGQDLPISTLILIVIGIAVAAFIIAGFYLGWWKGIFGKTQFLPGDLEALGQACKVALEGNLKISYCEYKELSIGGKTEYINCEDGRLTDTLKDITKERPSCSSLTPIAKCKELSAVAIGTDQAKQAELCAAFIKKGIMVNKIRCDADTVGLNCGVSSVSGPPTP